MSAGQDDSGQAILVVWGLPLGDGFAYSRCWCLLSLYLGVSFLELIAWCSEAGHEVCWFWPSLMQAKISLGMCPSWGHVGAAKKCYVVGHHLCGFGGASEMPCCEQRQAATSNSKSAHKKYSTLHAKASCSLFEPLRDFRKVSNRSWDSLCGKIHWKRFRPVSMWLLCIFSYNTLATLQTILSDGSSIT